MDTKQIDLIAESYANMTLEDRISAFTSFPYKKQPYSKRNWGNILHSLCSYQSKLKPSIAHFLIRIFTKPGETVIDPFSGVGTIPFEACLQGRIGMGVDISPVAYHSTLSKVRIPNRGEIEDVIEELSSFLENYKLNKEDYDCSILDNINGKLSDYYHRKTFIEILQARRFFKTELLTSTNPATSFVFSSLLHILHGNRPYALSRRSHGLTPYAPSGDFVYKPLVETLQRKLNRMKTNELPGQYLHGKAFLSSVFDFNELEDNIDCIITSPPFLNSTRFYVANWIRLWFCGWQDEDFRSSNRNDYLEHLQSKDIGIYKSVFKVFKEIVKKGGLCIMHLGVGKNRDMGLELIPFADEKGFEVIDLIYEDVQSCELHGIRDKGSTTKHQYLILANK